MRYGTDARGSPSGADDPRVEYAGPTVRCGVRESAPKIRRECSRVICRCAHAQPLDHWRSIVNAGVAARRTVARSVRVAPRDRTFRFAASHSARRRASARATRIVKYVRVCARYEFLAHNGSALLRGGRGARSFGERSSGTSTATVAIVIFFAKRRVSRDVTRLTS